MTFLTIPAWNNVKSSHYVISTLSCLACSPSDYLIFWQILLSTFVEQECIPGGCVLSAAVAVSGGGVCPGGCIPPCTEADTPPGQTDAFKNITFATSLRTVTNQWTNLVNCNFVAFPCYIGANAKTTWLPGVIS